VEFMPLIRSIDYPRTSIPVREYLALPEFRVSECDLEFTLNGLFSEGSGSLLVATTQYVLLGLIRDSKGSNE